MTIIQRENGKKYISRYVGYGIRIPDHLYYEWKRCIVDNKPLAPEVAGFLIGMANPYIRVVKCVYCNKLIKNNEVSKPTSERLEKLEWDNNKFAHEKCLLKHEKENG